MAGTGSNGSQRLDSWKAIAAYLGRDERTVQRWERKLALPVRRLPGGRGTSVFAYAAELDAWLAANEPAVRVTADLLPAQPPTEVAAAPDGEARASTRRWVPAVSAGALILAAGVGVWLWSGVSTLGLEVQLTPGALAAYSGGREVWRRPFVGERIELLQERQSDPVDVLHTEPRAVVAATGWRITTGSELVQSGQLLSFSPAGDPMRTFAFDDRLTFGGTEYRGPWGITDFRVDERAGRRRIAVAAHHHEWWPSLVTVLDPEWHRRSTFVHAGWIERATWLGPDQLLVAGFSEALDGGMVALIDPNVPRAQSPVPADSRFHCAGCGEGRPVRYVVMPRSEINRVTGSRFNRARLELNADRIVARTLETTNGDREVVDALYEFTPALNLIRASWSGRYWEVHSRLEAAGMIDHPRERCPDRNGPREVMMWEPGSGWTTVRSGLSADG